MKLLILFFSVVFFCQTPLSASQNNIPGPLSLGFYLGGNASRIYSNSLYKSNAHIGYHYGGYIRIGNDFFLRTDLAYFNTSAKLTLIDSINFNKKLKDNIDIQYYYLPLQLGLNVFKLPFKTLTVWTAFGGYYSYIDRVKKNEAGLLEQDFNETSFGLTASIGAEVFFIYSFVSLQRGLTPILKTDDNSFNTTLSFTVGLKF